MKRYCVIGHPIKHSLSPKIFNKWFKKLKISAKYKEVEVRPENLAEFMKSFCEKYAGANVTIPHKEKIIKFLDKLSLEAKAIGAVNVIVNRGGKLIGHNTDMFGAMAALKNTFGNLHRKKVIVLGAGGAARAVVYGLKKAGAKVTVLNRTVSRAKKLAGDFRLSGVGHRGFGELKDFDPVHCNILINATSAGMWPRIKETPFSRLKDLLRGLKNKPVVMDIIYRPRITHFLRDAKIAGCRIIIGNKMFLAQAQKTLNLFLQKF